MAAARFRGPRRRPARDRPWRPVCPRRPGRLRDISRNRSLEGLGQGQRPRRNLNARETGRNVAPALGRTAEAAVPKGYSDWVHQARVFPGPPGSRPARSLIYTHGGETYKATIGRPRRRSPGGPPAGSAGAKAGRGQESGNTVIAIMVT